MARPERAGKPRRLRALTGARLVMTLALVRLVSSAGAAEAGFQASTPAQSTSFSTLVVAPVGSLAGSAACGPAGSLSATVILTWSGTSTARATSYTVRRTTTAVYASVAQVAIGTTTYTDTGLAPGTTYTYVLRTNLNNWYGDSSPVSVTTPAVCP